MQMHKPLFWIGKQIVLLFTELFFPLNLKFLYLLHYTYLRTYYKNSKNSAYLSTVYGHFNQNP